MSLRDADIRFLLPELPATALVSAKLEEVRAGLEQAGVEIHGVGAEPETGHPVSSRPDVAVLTPSDAAALGADVADGVIVLGRGRQRVVRGRRSHLRRFVAVPGLREPRLIVPLDRPAVMGYAIRSWSVANSTRRLARNAAAGALLRLGAFPEPEASIAVAFDADLPPAMVAAAADLGVPPTADWFLTLGTGDALSRTVFHLFAPGAGEPSWALKFSRLPGYSYPFDRDERGLGLAVSAGATTAAHAPRLLGRLTVGGLPGSLEQAIPGARMTHLLQRLGSRREKLDAVNTVAEWIIAVGRETAAPPATAAAEHGRLREAVLPAWRNSEALGRAGARIPADLVERVGTGVPGVLQHNDLGCWNLVVSRRSFAAVDWESANPCGLPLWDLVYFLVDALVHLDGAWKNDSREQHAARLLRGELPSSAILFRWLRTAVDSLSLPAESVGPIVTLAWLHHGLSAGARAVRVSGYTADGVSVGSFGEWMARVWLTAPGLGPDWPAWQQAS
jgi:hypothetical protein